MEHPEHSSIAGSDEKVTAEVAELGQVTVSSDEQGQQETTQTGGLGGFGTDSAFFIRNLSYTAEEEKKIIRIVDTRLFRKYLPFIAISDTLTRCRSRYFVFHICPEHVIPFVW
jgi:hypothetical protein